jgi:putative glutamine transport system permease protein
MNILLTATLQDESLGFILTRPWVWESLWEGFLNTMYVSAWAVVIAFVVGTIVGVARYTRLPVVSWIAAAYTELLRNIPLALLMLMLFLLGRMQDVQAAILALGVFTSAIIAEVVRGGLNSIPKGQWEAARSQGLSYMQILRHIVLPQATVSMIPPFISQVVTVVKDSSFAWQLGYIELTARSRILQNLFTSPEQILVIYAVVALIYFVVNFLISESARRLQRKLQAGRGSIGTS